MQKDLELRLISLIQEKDLLNDAIKQGVEPDCFVLYKDQFEFMSKYKHKYGAQPTTAILEANYNDFKIIEGIGDDELKYLSDELQKSNVARKAIGIINKYQDILIADPYGATEAIISHLSKVKKMTNVEVGRTDKNAMERLQELLDRKAALAAGGIMGIKTGFSVLDRKQLGWQPGNLIIIVGRPKVGKSFLALYMACHAYSSGKKVLYVSPEMSTPEINLRWDTMMGRMNGFNFLNDKLQLGDVDQMKYKQWLERASKRNDWITVDNYKGKAFSVDAIASLIDDHKPDEVIVDGVALLSGEGNAKWEKVMSVIYDLKALTQATKTTTVGVCQANRDAGNNMPDATNIAYSDAILQACDVGIMMNMDPETPDVRYCTIPVVRGMAPINKRMVIKYDPNAGIIQV